MMTYACFSVTLYRYAYPTVSVHPVFVLIHHPREMKILCSQTVM